MIMDTNKNTWNIYKIEYVYTKAEDGNLHQNVLSLELISEGLKNFSTACWPIVEKTKKALVEGGARESCLSRSSDWCVDHLNRDANENDKVRDDMLPSIIGIEIISTPFVLTLKAR